MLVGDMVNERQKRCGLPIQSFLCNAGSVVGVWHPLCAGMVPEQYRPRRRGAPHRYVGLLYRCHHPGCLHVVYTFARSRRCPRPNTPPSTASTPPKEAEKPSENWFKLLVKAPKVLPTVGLVQFFCWAAFLYMWDIFDRRRSAQAFDAPPRCRP